MRTIVYDPSAPVPAVTRENERVLKDRLLELRRTGAFLDPHNRAQRVAQFEFYLIEAMFAAAVRGFLRTLADGWRVVSPRSMDAVRCYEGSPQYQGLQNEFAEALNNLNTYLSR